MQGENKILYFQNGTENNCGILRNSQIHQSIEISQRFFTPPTDLICAPPVTRRCRDENPTCPKHRAECPWWRKLWQFWFNSGRDCCRGERTLCFLYSPTWRSRTELSLAIFAATCATRSHWFLQDQFISEEDVLKGVSELPCGSEAAPQRIGRYSR